MNFPESSDSSKRSERAGSGSPRRGFWLPRSGAKSFSPIIALAISVSFAGCTPDRSNPRNGTTPRPPIVIVVLDTVRADHLSPYARPGAGAATPVLERFAHSALVYEQARSAASLTMPALAGLMTGRYPHAVGITGHSRADRLNAGVETLASVARRAGYRTAAVVTNPWLAHPASGFTRDFDTFISGHSLGRGRARMHAAEVVDQAAHILATTDGRPLLLWVHFLDAHMPYTDGELRTRITEDFAKSSDMRSRIFFETPYSPEDIAATRAAYASAIARIDTALGRLFDQLPAKAIVVVVADHGESLGEHDLYFAHDFTVHDELLRVPIMLRAPGVSPGRDATAVSLIDVLPTICALARLDCGKPLDGLRLPNTGGDDDGARFVTRTLYAASTPGRARYRCPWLTVGGNEGRMTMALAAGHKLIRTPTPSGAVYRAYDLADDPGEMSDRFDATKDRSLVRELDAWSVAAAVPRTMPTAFPKPLSRELRELGYLE